MHQDDPALEQRLSRFEAQLDRFSFALRQWQETQAHPHPENPSDLDQRIRSLEETVSRESLALRQLHEEPLKQLQGHAESLSELSRNLQALVTDHLESIDAREVNSIEIPGSDVVVRVGRYGPYLERGEQRAALRAGEPAPVLKLGQRVSSTAGRGAPPLLDQSTARADLRPLSTRTDRD